MNILHNLRHGFRLWVHNPGFTAIAALTVALGVGPNVAIFSAIWGIFLAPLPYRDANQLVVVWTKINGERNPSPADDYLQYLAQSKSFQELAFLGWQPATFNSNDPSEEPVPGNPVTAGYISKYLGYSLAMGRDFLPEETTPGHDQVVVLGHRFWVERFHSDPNILGKQISIDGRPHTIVGVQRPGGSDRQGARFQVPLVLNPAGHNSQYGNIFGRLKPGVTIAQAQAELAVINQRLAATRQMAYRNSSIGVEQMRNDWLDKKVARTLWLLLAAVGFVLLIACANLANLLLGRGTSRQREIAVRAAIGASRWQVFAQLLVESFALSILGCAMGIGFAWALIKLVIAIQPGFLEQVTEANIELNIPALLFAIGIAVLSGILSGCAPAWRASRLNLTETLNQGSQSVIGGRRGRTQAILVVSEFALAITLLSGAGMAMHSFWKLATIDLGFRPDHILETELRIADPKDHNPEQMATAARQVLDQLRSIPGVQDATLTTGLPLSGAGMFPFNIAGHATGEKDRPVADLESVTPSFFVTFGIQLLKGRQLDENDTAATTPVVVVNEAFVRHFLAGTDPLTQRLQITKLTPDPKNPGALIGGPPVERQIVGVFRDVRNQGQLTDDVASEMCIPYWQAPWPCMAVAVRSALDPALMTKSLRGAIVSSGRRPGPIDILKQRVQDQRKGERFGTVLFGAFASLALLLAPVGIYGVMTFAVAQRGHEVGLRMALGAQQEEVLRLILKDGLRLGLYGAATGVGGVYALGRLMRSTLYGLHTVDPLSLGIVAAVLFTAAFFACYIPARRAAKVDPMVRCGTSDQRRRNMTGLLQDVRFAFRQLGRTPGFTMTAVLTLALGIGANAAIFTLMNAVLMKNLPVADPKSLLLFADWNFCCVGTGTPPDGDYGLFSTDTYEQLKKNAPEFEAMAAMQAGFEYRPIVARRGGTPETARSVMGEFVSGNYFRTLGVRPAAGRLFSDADDSQGAPIVALMSYEKWKNDYDSDRSIVGSTFFVNTKPVTIAGIAPERFYGDRLSTTPPDLYLPIESMPVIANVPYVHDADTNWLYIVGRVKPGYSIQQVQAKMSGRLRQALATTRTYSTEDQRAKLPKVHIVLTPGGAGIQHLQEGYASQLKLLMWTSVLVLLIACANIANLLLVRGMARKAEMSVRTALGAVRRRIIFQLLTESVLLSGLGGVAGLLVAYAGTRMLLAIAFPGAAGSIHAGPSPAVLGFACGLTLLTGILFGIAPAWIAARTEPADALRSGSRTTAGGASVFQRGLVVAQAGVSLVLLVGAGLFSQSLNRLEHIDLRLDSTNRYIVHFNPQAPGYTQRQVGDLYRTLEQRFHAIPGVEKVGISTYTPMEDNNNGFSVRVQGQPDPNISASFIKANADYFDSVGTRVIAGRGILETDTPASTIIAVVNESFVKKLFKPGENPIGQHFGAPNRPGDYEIAGVVEDTAYTDATWRDHPMYFAPLLQRPAEIKKPIENDEMMYASAIVLKTARPMNDMEALARRTLSEINPNLAITKFQSFDRQIADRFNDQRMLAQLTSLFGLLALLLTIVGLYGVTAYAVARRTSEIGIRVALGAERLSVTAMVLRGALIQIILGLALGIPAAFFCVRLISSQLYQMKHVSLTALGGAVVVLLASGVLASLIPARRAAKVDPMVALRYE